MTRTAWFHCFSGISGDMTLGALVDAGADVEEIVRLLRRLPVKGWSIEPIPAMRNGISATHMQVEADEPGLVRTYAHITGLIEEARFPEPVRNMSLAIFAALAEAEGKLHRRPVSQVHFHEVGGLDAIVDIVGSAIALHLLGVEEVQSSPVANGLGMIRTAHGMLPNPAPAVVELLKDCPTYGLDISVELTTPTGAAILAALAKAWGPMPSMTISSSGFGAGTRELDDHPNLLQVVIGETVGPPSTGQPVVVLETNLDDVTGEQIAHTIETLIDVGAHDAWVTNVLMKKGRPGFIMSALCDPSKIEVVRDAMSTETGSLGVRATWLDRWPAPRKMDDVVVEGLPVRRKIGPHRIKAEYADAARVSKLTGLPLREVQRLAEETSGSDDYVEGADNDDTPRSKSPRRIDAPEGPPDGPTPA